MLRRRHLILLIEYYSVVREDDEIWEADGVHLQQTLGLAKVSLSSAAVLNRCPFESAVTGGMTRYRSGSPRRMHKWAVHRANVAARFLLVELIAPLTFLTISFHTLHLGS